MKYQSLIIKRSDRSQVSLYLDIVSVNLVIGLQVVMLNV